MIIFQIEIISSAKGIAPVIIINLLVFCNSFEKNTKDTVFGGRFNKIKKEFSDFLSRLVDAGAELYFVFKEEYCEEEFNLKLWSNSEEEGYQHGIHIIDKIHELKQTDKIVDHFEKRIYLSNRCFPFNPILMVVLAQTAEKYGTICGEENIRTERTSNHASLANRKKAMAIIGLDTYYFFYEGLK